MMVKFDLVLGSMITLIIKIICW